MKADGFTASVNICGLFGKLKRLIICDDGWRWCQVLDGVLGAMGVIEEIKTPVVAGGLVG